MFQLINGRYERKLTIITTNVPLSSWGTVIRSTAKAETILDRLVYHSHVTKIKGKSYRLASVNSKTAIKRQFKTALDILQQGCQTYRY